MKKHLKDRFQNATSDWRVLGISPLVGNEKISKSANHEVHLGTSFLSILFLKYKRGIIMAKRKDCGRVGYEFEDKLKAVFSDIKGKHKFDFHRYTDSKAAGRIVNPQPADFQICFIDDKSSNHVIMVEAKASEEIESLKSCASSHISAQQVGKHKAWLRAGGKALFLFYCEITCEVEVWGSAHVVAQRSAGTPLDLNERLAVIDYLDLKDELIKFFKIRS